MGAFSIPSLWKSNNSMQFPSRIFVTGIGTDVGKSYATGWLARLIAASGQSVITQKFIQTGNDDMSEDIIVHRRVMGLPLLTEDLLHITAPVIFSYPASPDLAAAIDNREIDFDAINHASDVLASKFRTVLIEGAGGIMVPLKGDYLTIDYIRERRLPTAVVVNGRLGSVSDSLLTLEAIQRRDIHLFAVIWNPYFDKDKTIADNSREYLKAHVRKHFPGTLWLEMPQKL